MEYCVKELLKYIAPTCIFAKTDKNGLKSKN